MQELRKQFGRNVRRLRLLRDLTQEQFAEAAGISVDFLSLIERGRNAPSFETLEVMAEALHLRVMDLFDFGQRPSRPRAEGRTVRGNNNL